MAYVHGENRCMEHAFFLHVFQFLDTDYTSLSVSLKIWHFSFKIDLSRQCFTMIDTKFVLNFQSSYLFKIVMFVDLS